MYMKKIALLTALVLISSGMLTGCGRVRNLIANVTNRDAADDSDKETRERSTSAPEKETEAETLPTEETTTEPETTEPTESMTWQEAYLDVIYGMDTTNDFGYTVSVNDFKGALIYLDNDDIPEMYFAYSEFEAPAFGGIYTFRDGKAELINPIARNGEILYGYKERGSEFYVYRMYSLVDELAFYKLGKSKESAVYSYEYGEPYGSFLIDDLEYTETDYTNKLSAAEDGFITPELVTKTELISKIQNAEVSTNLSDSLRPSTSSSRYLICKDAVTWEQAEHNCELMGGHLAYIKSADDFNTITSALSETNLRYVWVGGQTTTAAGVTIGKWLDGSSMKYVNDNDRWFTGEPSGYDHTASDYTPEPYVMLWNVKDKWSFNDNSDAALDAYKPEYIGYICEFDNVASGVEIQ